MAAAHNRSLRSTDELAPAQAIADSDRNVGDGARRGDDDTGSTADSTSTADLRRTLSEAEALYSTGVAANLDQRWSDAQVAFERAIRLIGDVDLDNAANPANGDKIEHLLDEIAVDYQQTLVALGQLDADASSAAVLLRFKGVDSTGHGSDAAPQAAEPAQENPKESFDFPVETNREVQNCIVFYQTVAREPFERFLHRAGRYLPMMKKIVASYGIPSDLAYLPFVESGFNNNAYSYAHAAGAWQFIASTGHRYGLDRNAWVDERRDFEKSTHAACCYLRDLYRMFGSWQLALAAYNGGEGRVSRQIDRQRTHDFWKLRLKEQTRDYVPLYIAALMIAKDPKAYGFDVETDPPLEFDWVATNKPLDLKDVAQFLGCTQGALEDLNPELRRDVTPPNVAPYRLRVPKGTAAQFAVVYRDLPSSTKTAWAEHTVRRGETVASVAKRYGVTVTEVIEANNLPDDRRLKVGQTLLVPTPTARVGERPELSRSKKDSPPSAGQTYTVREGETLWELAKRFGTTSAEIRTANQMQAHDRLAIGQKLIIPGRGVASTDHHGGFWYTVRRGDTILRIAARYGLSIAQVLASNSLTDPDQLHVGQRLHIPTGL